MRFSRVFSIEIFFSQPFLPEISPSFILNEISALSQMRFLHGKNVESVLVLAVMRKVLDQQKNQ
jgi:hypothetical protein